MTISDDSTAEYRGVVSGELRDAFVVNGVRTQASYPSGQIDIERKRFARLVLGAMLVTGPVAPLQASTAGSANDPRIDVVGPDGLLANIQFAPQQRVPILLRYPSKVRMPPMVPVTGAGSGAGALPALEDVEVTMRLEDRGPFGGLQFPRTIVTEARGITLEAIRFESVSVNPGLTLRDFEIPR
jgi:hypothetical protein